MIFRFAAFVYTPAGKQATERLWQETIDEFKFVNVQDILESVGKF